MKRYLLTLTVAMTFCLTSIAADFGFRGGLNLTTMTFNAKDFKPNNHSGYYFGPTVRCNLPLGLGFDASALYDQREADADIYMTSDDLNPLYSEKFPVLKRKTLAVPLNLRWSMSLAGVVSVFVFAGPQFEFSLNKDIEEQDLEWKWKSSTYSVNIGGGVTLAKHLEVRVNYNIPCGETGHFSMADAYDTVSQSLSGKTGAWQLGAAIYF